MGKTESRVTEGSRSLLLLNEAADLLTKNKSKLAKEMSDVIYRDVESYRKGIMPQWESIRATEVFIENLVNILRQEKYISELENRFDISDFSKYEDGIASRRVKYGIDLTDLLLALNVCRYLIWDFLEKNLKKAEYSGSDFFVLEERVNSFVYRYIVGVSNSYLRSKEQIIQLQESDLHKWEEVVKSASSIELKIPCKEEFAAVVRIQAESIARRLDYDEEEVQDIKSAVGEACDNAIEHGKSDKGIDVHYHLSGTHLLMEITDYGKGFDPVGMGEVAPDPLAERGRGLFLIRSLVDSVEIKSRPGEGTQVTLTKEKVFK